MIPKSLVTVLILASPLFAQHEGHQHDGAAAPAATTETAKAGGMMCEEMMAKKKAAAADTAKLADQLAEGLTALDQDQLPAAIKEKLAANLALAKDLQSKLGKPEECKMCAKMDQAKMGKEPEKK